MIASTFRQVGGGIRALSARRSPGDEAVRRPSTGKPQHTGRFLLPVAARLLLDCVKECAGSLIRPQSAPPAIGGVISPQDDRFQVREVVEYLVQVLVNLLRMVSSLGADGGVLPATECRNLS